MSFSGYSHLFNLIPQKSYKKIFLASAFVFAVAVAGIFLFRYFLHEELQKHSDAQIYDYAGNQEMYFHGQMTVLHDYIHFFSSRIENMRRNKNSDQEIFAEILPSVFYVRFLYSGIIFKNGDCWYSDGESLLKDVYSGSLHRIFCDHTDEIFSLVNEINGEKFLSIFKPIRWAVDETAYAFASIPFSHLSDMLFLPPGGKNSVLLVDPDSMNIFFSTGQDEKLSHSFFPRYMEGIGMRRFSGELISAIKNGRSCLINQSNISRRILFQKPLNYENWSMVVSMSSDFDSRLREKVMLWFLFFSLGIIFLIIGLLLYIIFSSRINASILSKTRSRILSQQQDFDVIADNYNGGIVMTQIDGTGTILYCNQGALDLFGYTMDEIRFLLHGEARNLFENRSFDEFRKFYDSLSDSQDKIQSDVRMKKKDGTVFWCRIQGRIVGDENGGRRGIWAVYDIDERKRLEEKLVRSESLLRVSSGLTSDFVFCYHFGTKTIDTPNEAMLRMGFPHRMTNAPERLIRKGYVHPDSVSDLRELIRRVEKGEPDVSGILRLCPNGKVSQWFDVRFSVQDGAGGKLPYAIVVMRDITKEKSSEIRYVHELNYRKASLTGVLASYEFNISNDRIIGGPESSDSAKSGSFTRFTAWYINHMVHPEDRYGAGVFFAKARLQKSYSGGVCSDRFEYREMKDTGLWRWVRAAVTLFLNSQNEDLCMRVHLSDISSEKEEELALRRRAEYDSLLEIPNRYFYEDIVSAKLKKAGAGNGCSVFAVFDVDNFKLINDTYGHQAGDRALQQLVQAMKEVFSENSSFVGRLGGDEFSVYLFGCKSLKKAVSEFSRFIRYLNRTSLPFDGKRHLTVSVGCTQVFEGDSFETLYRRADHALYQAKEQGKNRVVAN